MDLPLRTVAFFGTLAVLQPGPVSATMLQFFPPSQTVTGPASVDVFIADLRTEVGGFEIDVSFDPTILSPMSIVFTSSLGDVSLGEATNTFTFLPNTIELTALSFLAEAELDPLQPESFALATILFNTLAEGTSPLTFAQSDLVDALGQPIAVTLTDASVTKVIPEPATCILLASGLTLGAWRRMRRTGTR